MRVGFHSNQLCLRGSEVAMYDYAHFNEELLGNESVIITPDKTQNHHPAAIEKFGKRFKILTYESLKEFDPLLGSAKVDVCYCIKAGIFDGLVSANCKVVVHAVFPYKEPHGAVYAYVSEWLSKKMSDGRLPFVPHMVNLPSESSDLRSELGIPKSARVFGRYGGEETFDTEFVRKAVIDVAAKRPDTFFIFMGTPNFGPKLPNIIFLESTADSRRKVQFINSCEAMLHGGSAGETFGLAVGEFSSQNKPVLCWATPSTGWSHLELLGDVAVLYYDYHDLVPLLEEFKPVPGKVYDVYSERFSPKNIMKKFGEVFF